MSDDEGRVERQLDRVPLLVDPDGNPISRREARRRQREERRRREHQRKLRPCELCERHVPKRRRLPNGVRVCPRCWGERREVPGRPMRAGQGTDPPPEPLEDGPSDDEELARRGLRAD